MIDQRIEQRDIGPTPRHQLGARDCCENRTGAHLGLPGVDLALCLERACQLDGQTVDATYLQGATVPLNVKGLPGVAMRFGTSSAGLPINVQIVGAWHAEPMILHVASLLESVSQVRDMRPVL